MIEGIKILREVYVQPKFRDLWEEEVVPGIDVKSDKEILRAIRQGRTVYHPVGTCKMGVDKEAVVSDLRVHGVDGLRVVDASIMP